MTRIGRLSKKAKQFEKSTARVWLVYTVWKPNVATIRCKKILQATLIRRCKPIFLYMSSDKAFTLNASQYQIFSCETVCNDNIFICVLPCNDHSISGPFSISLYASFSPEAQSSGVVAHKNKQWAGLYTQDRRVNKSTLPGTCHTGKLQKTTKPPADNPTPRCPNTSKYSLGPCDCSWGLNVKQEG